MPDYKKMYTALFNAQTDAIRILQNAQLKTEEMYIDSPDPEIIMMPDEPLGEPLPNDDQS